MQDNTDIKIKRSIFILIFILVIIIVTIVLLVLDTEENKTSETNTNNEANNAIVSEENTSNDTINNTLIDENETYTTYSLEKINSVSTYIIMKQCLEKYHDNAEIKTTEFLENMVDDEAISKIDKSVLEEMISGSATSFSIDDLYGQILSENEKIYLVYYRISPGSGYENRAVLVRLDTENKTFSIYPYEYLQLYGYEQYGEGDVITIDNLPSIEKNENNEYSDDDISVDAETCLKELFEKYKFDLLLDVEHLYNSLDQEYRNLKFATVEDLEQYIQEHRTDLYLDRLYEYKATDEGDYIQFTGTSTNNRCYVFRAEENLMEYTLFLDNYTIVTDNDSYSASFDPTRCRYCIDRVMQAINENDYDFVYEHLNPVQKNNYYKNEEDFIEFIEDTFYDKNNYSIGDDYLIVSSTIYQFSVRITSTDENSLGYEDLTMSVTLKDDTDFSISIVVASDE